MGRVGWATPSRASSPSTESPRRHKRKQQVRPILLALPLSRRALQDAGDEQELVVGRDRTQDRRGEEAHEAAEEDAFAAKDVAEGARGEQEAGHDECVGVDDPLELGHVRR